MRAAEHPQPAPGSLMRLLARALCSLPCALALVACEPMPPSGAPFSPVAAGSNPADAAAGDPRFDRPEPKTWTSEELHAAASAPSAPNAAGGVVVSSGSPMGGAPTPTAAAGEPAAASEAGAAPTPADSPAPAAPVASRPAGAAAPTAVAAPAQATSAGAATLASTPSAWPLRLVRALPDTIPPRAILGLPDGREVVVSPGAMLPEVGVVVMAIGRERLQVARITAQGDHAAVHELTLSSQY